jgi:creatinine amidohydrolase/Fe(II)-dependent formamide hydrolase-like protein
MRVMPWWSAFSLTGIQGDASKGTAEKGEAFLAAAVEECLGFVHDLLAKPLPQRREPQETL